MMSSRSEPFVSVVIPCYNKSGLIRDVLLALTRQTLPADRLEVLVVDDGSTDDTGEVVTGIPLPQSFRYLRQPNQGAAAARNLGAHKARGKTIVFLDGDVVADPGLLEKHMSGHGPDSRKLVMGRLRDLPHEHADLFYRSVHPEAFFDHGDEVRTLPFIEGFTGNLSVRRDAFWQIGGFDEEFPRSGFEDTEFIYRATKAGCQLIYDPRAVGYHDGFITFGQACQHMRSYQASAVLLMRKHPELAGCIPHLRDKEPIHWRNDEASLVGRKLVRQVLALPTSMWLLKKTIGVLERVYPHPDVLRFMYWKVLGSCLLLGFRDGMRHYGSPF